MNASHEIIITTRENPKEPRVAQFSDLYAVHNDITKMLYLWDTNSYYVNAEARTFTINGGRKITFADYKECKILYRRRNQLSYAVDGSEELPIGRKVNWLLGIEEIETKRVVFLIISEDGQFWKWANKL